MTFIGINVGITSFRLAVGNSIKAILNISGSKGLVTDAAVGTLVNGRTSTATVTDFEGVVKTAKVGEIRHDGGRRVENLEVHSTSDWVIGNVTGTYSEGEFTALNLSSVNYVKPNPQIIGDIEGKILSTRITIKALDANSVGKILLIQYRRNSGGVYVGKIKLIRLTADFKTYQLSFIGLADNIDAYIQLGFSSTDNNTNIVFKDVLSEELTGQTNQSPSEYIDSATIYNAGIAGVKYFDTLNANTVDGDDVVTEAAGVAISPPPTLLHEGAGTNYALQSDAPATQTIALTAGNYTVWLDDNDNLGTITLSGDTTGVVNSTDINGLQFTSAGTATTFTHSGSGNIRWQIEKGNYRTSHIPTTTAPVTRSADRVNLPLAVGTNFYQNKGVLLFRWVVGWSDTDVNDSYNKGMFSLINSQNSLLIIADNGTSSGLVKSTDGIAWRIVSTGGWSAGDELLSSVIWNDAESMFAINYSKDGGITWLAWNQTAYDGAFTTGSNINLFYNNPYINNLKSAQVYKPTPTDDMASMKAWVESNAGSLT